MTTASAADPTAALIVHKQTAFTRQFSRSLSTTFASTVANRFYSDNSLGRQRRIVECTKRRQSRAREKALEQEHELAQLQLQYEHKRRLRELQSQRETSRMTRKLQHVAAAYIQHVYRTFVHRKRVDCNRKRAIRLVADFCARQWRRRCQVRSRAARRIQRRWRVYKTKQLHKRCVWIIQAWILSLVHRRRLEYHCAAVQIQIAFRFCRWRRRRAAARSIQRAWGFHSIRCRLFALLEKARMDSVEAHRNSCARTLQRTLARFTVRCRLLRSPVFARFCALRASRRRHHQLRSVEVWGMQHRVLTDAVAQAKCLQSEETTLRSELEVLEKRAVESRAKLADERERLRRFHAWAELRRAKEDEQMREHLREWESRKRFEIRMELERELELERRAQLRSQQLHGMRASQEEARVDDGPIVFDKLIQSPKMARDELVELLSCVRRGVALDELRESIPQIHRELVEIQRKRSHFLEDACAAVLTQSLGSSRAWDGGDSSDSESIGDSLEFADETGSILSAVKVCTEFAEPLVRGLPRRTASEDPDTTRERAVLVAFVLAVLGRSELAPDERASDELFQSCESLAALVISSGIDLHTIVWTLRFREELHMFRSMMMPTKATADDSEVDGDGDDSGSDEDGEEDTSWLVHTVASAAGFAGPLEYFLKESGHENAFASWSPVGITRLVVLILTSSSGLLDGGTNVLSIVSPYTSMFAMGPIAQALLQAQTIQTKRQGLVVLKYALNNCAPNGLIIDDSSVEMTGSKALSFAEASAAYRRRDWITPLVELTSNAMVSFPDATDRALGLAIFRQLLQIVEVGCRFWLSRRLALRCPYGNIAAILVDQLRNDTFRVWSSPVLFEEATPHKSSAIAQLIVSLLDVLVERDLKMHADLVASVASLIRFVAIRDKENRTELRMPGTLEIVKVHLDRLRSRLRSTMGEVAPSIQASGATDMHALLHDENARFVLVEAALDSTISLLSSC